jgi:molybdopterin converting factor small subunit
MKAGSYPAGVEMPLVMLYAYLRSATGQKEWHVPDTDIQAVLEKLTQAYPAQGLILSENG